MSESNQLGVVLASNAVIGLFRVRSNHLVAKVNGVNTVLSGSEFERLLRDGYTLEAMGSECETGA